MSKLCDIYECFRCGDFHEDVQGCGLVDEDPNNDCIENPKPIDDPNEIPDWCPLPDSDSHFRDVGLIGRKLIYFGYNYPSDFIKQVWEHDKGLAEHLTQKFNGYYVKYGSKGVFAQFFVNLSSDHQVRLVNWINDNYKGVS